MVQAVMALQRLMHIWILCKLALIKGKPVMNSEIDGRLG
jgi:hypothetical protein